MLGQRLDSLENEKVMIDSFDINKELETVEMHLRNAHKDDKRIERWKGYRDALFFVKKLFCWMGIN